MKDISPAVVKFIQDRQELKRGLISQEEFDRRSGFEKRGHILNDPEWKTFIKSLFGVEKKTP